eukprot:SAG11_NODE_7939_length_1079_cov_1.144898_1_plen_81_part_10
MSFVTALRVYLTTFKLPGESMLIERLFSTWAARFFRNNPGDFVPHQQTEDKIAKYRTAFDALVEAQPLVKSASLHMEAGAV